MAQTITCDAHQPTHPADWLVTSLGDGDSRAYCNAAYMELMQGAVDAAAQVEADQTAADIERRLAGVRAPARDGEPDQAARNLPETTEDGEPILPTPIAGHVVKRGQSARAIAHREKVAAKAGREAPAAIEPRDPDDDDDENEDEATREGAAPADTATPRS